MSVSPTPSLQLAEYLEKLPGTTFRKLYQQPSTAFAIFRRMLPHLGKRLSQKLQKPTSLSARRQKKERRNCCDLRELGSLWGSAAADYYSSQRKRL
jgi:hypothetical protein